MEGCFLHAEGFECWKPWNCSALPLLNTYKRNAKERINRIDALVTRVACSAPVCLHFSGLVLAWDEFMTKSAVNSNQAVNAVSVWNYCCKCHFPRHFCRNIYAGWFSTLQCPRANFIDSLWVEPRHSVNFCWYDSLAVVFFCDFSRTRLFVTPHRRSGVYTGRCEGVNKDLFCHKTSNSSRLLLRDIYILNA